MACNCLCFCQLYKLLKDSWQTLQMCVCFTPELLLTAWFFLLASRWGFSLPSAWTASCRFKFALFLNRFPQTEHIALFRPWRRVFWCFKSSPGSLNSSPQTIHTRRLSEFSPEASSLLVSCINIMTVDVAFESSDARSALLSSSCDSPRWRSGTIPLQRSSVCASDQTTTYTCAHRRPNRHTSITSCLSATQHTTNIFKLNPTKMATLTT